MIITFLVIAFSGTTLASFCGSNGVPYSLEILSDGSPVLGCAQPTCIAEPLDEYEDSEFLTNDAGQEDGFFREGDRQRKKYSHSNKHKAECPGEFSDLACTSKNQWVGGIAYNQNSEDPITLQCCAFEGLRFSQDVGVTTISAGEAVTGGEVIRDGRQISFDVIANVRRLVDPDDLQKTYYEVTVRRMNCLPDPAEFEVAYDDDVAPEIIRVLSNAVNSKVELHKMKKEDKPTHRRPYKRKPKTSSTNSVVTPITHEEKRKKHEPFFGSFGAPIYNPTGEVEEVEVSEETIPTTIATTTTTTEAPFTTTRAPIAYTRRIVTLKPRFRPTTTTTAAPKVVVQIEPVAQQQQIQPTTSPSNPFGFAPLPPFPNLFQLGLQPPPAFSIPPPPPAPLLPTHQPFGQPPGFAQPAHFGLFHQTAPPAYGIQPSYQPYGVQASNNNDLSHLDSYTRSLLTEPDSPFSLKSHFPIGEPYQQQQAHYAGYANVQPPAPQPYQINMGAPQRVEIPGIRDSDIVQPVLAPQHQQLGNLYRPPPFAALGTTIYNFQSNPRKSR